MGGRRVSGQKALAGFQADQAGGKGPDYTEIGDVAQRAFTAYNHGDYGSGGGGGEEGKKDLAKIGKGIATGFGGRKTEEGKLGGTDGDDDLAVSRSNAGDTTGLANKTLPGGELDSSTEKKGLNSHARREAGDSTGWEKGGLGEDEGVFTGNEGDKTDVRRSSETTTPGQGLGRSGQQPAGITGDEEETLGNQPVEKWMK
ncbi:hypothetical protein COL5a_003315 [Colletotrichum fioriniae]|uniref:uncharacterized protein n=1 Tax=Colletotrichum fioriniae TaxID=710243 RepID=UPI0032D9E413|nr:hypothetical protein COL5a_003315 [Colletotrichum fioriniae]KAJ3947939.1 hypothetical protein N0V96_002178 [Colletotrichum fioriniae]